MRRHFLTLVPVLAVGLAAGILVAPRLAHRGAPPPERRILYYADPMHPSYKSDKPGIAPESGMKLEPVYADGAGSVSVPAGAPAADASKRKILYWVDPMHPSYKSDKPGIAPDCGMKLEPVYADQGGAGGEPGAPGSFRISPEKQQLIGVRFGEVKPVRMSSTIRTVGRIAYDERRVGHVHTKFEGWANEVLADFTGQYVHKGQPMLTVYSPELVAAEEELLLAQKAKSFLSDSPVKDVRASAESLFAAARRKLELWDITGDQIEEIVRRGEPVKNMTVFAPLTGFVLSRNIFPHQRITTESELYTIVDLSRVWAIADVYEYEAANVKLGQPVKMTLSYEPGRVWRGVVSYIYPQVDSATRTIKVRADFANADMRLKPDMFANIEFVSDYGRQLAVPEEAVMNSGLATTVFVDRGNGYLEPRKVELGQKMGNEYAVKSGLKEGERVVISGNFLVDSESRLKSAEASMAAMPGMDHQPDAPASPAQKPDHEGAHR